MDQLVKIGPIEFEHSSIRPATPAVVNAWIKEVLPLFESLGLTAYILAGFVDRPSLTKDVDVVLTGDITYWECYSILKKIYELAFYKYKFNLDAQWFSFLPNYSISVRKRQVVKLRLMNKVTLNNKLIWDKIKESEQVYPGLYKIKESMPSKKQLKYMKDGLVYSAPIKLESNKISWIT